MQSHKIGIHTIEISMCVNYPVMLHICNALDYPKKETISFLYYRSDCKKGEDNCSYLTSKVFTLSNPGVKSFYAYHHRSYSSEYKKCMSKYYIYLRIEPLTMINKIQHIAVFSPSEKNMDIFRESFRQTIRNLFQLSSEHYYIAEIEKWNAERIDYTVDVKMEEPEDVTAFLNLCKWSVIPNKYMKSIYTSYGVKFNDYGLLLCNNSWELNIYNKRQQVENEYKDIDDINRQRLLLESQNIVRIEFRFLKPKITALAPEMNNGRQVTEFMNIQIAEEFLLKVYEKNIGFEDFYTMYHAEKKLMEAFPLPKRKAKKAPNNEKSDKYKKHREFLNDVMIHKGLGNTYKHISSNLEGKALVAAKARFHGTIDRIRKKVGISPVVLPETWRHRKNMNLPTDILPNPLREYRQV